MRSLLGALIATASMAGLTGPGTAGPDEDLTRVLEMESRFAAVVEKARPTVVAIQASFRPGPREAAPEPPPRRSDPVLPLPLESVDPAARRRAGTGSGVLVSADGLVLTNHHVAGWATTVFVIRADGTRHRAEVVGTDPRGDLALLRIPGEDLPFAPLGPDDGPEPGSWVFAMGNPFTLALQDGDPIVTQGVVSGLHRIQRGDARGELFYGDAIQTDAEINPGNSGGPLFDLEGRLVGINGRIATRRANYRVNTGVGFAVSARQIRRVLPKLRAGGRVEHGYLGIRYDVDESTAAGVEVAFAYEESPAATAGILAGDRIVAIDGRPVRSGSALAGILSTYPEGARIRVAFTRRGERIDAEAVLVARPAGASR